MSRAASVAKKMRDRILKSLRLQQSHDEIDAEPQSDDQAKDRFEHDNPPQTPSSA